MSFRFQFSLSLSLGLGQPAPEIANQHHRANNSGGDAAMPLASSTTASPISVSSQDCLPTTPRTPLTRAPTSTTPQAPKCTHHASSTHGLTAGHAAVDEGHIDETTATKAKDRESLEVLLRCSKASVKPKKCTTASSVSPSSKTSIATNSTSGSDLASSLQSLRVQAMANYFQDMDSAAASMASSGSPSSMIQSGSVQEVSSAEELSQNNVEGQEMTASVSESPPPPASPASSSMYQSVESDVPGEEINDGAEDGIAVEKVGATCVENLEGSVSSDEDWEMVTAEDIIG
ncbi:hypothetical protein Q7P37_001893 [Cladosporium fusiforme]